MSTAYTATTIIGYRIVADFTEKKIPNCVHTWPEGAKYCPTCGLRTGFHTVEVRSEEWEACYNELTTNLPEGYIFEESNDVFWLGYGGICYPGEAESVPLKPYDEIKQKIYDILKSYLDRDVFVLHEKDFAIWTLNIGH